jgi:flagellar biosynthesis/type III secretory pathway protein FliH
MSIFICYGEKTIIFVSIQDHLYQATEMANMTVEEQQKYDKAMFTEIDRIAQINYARKEGKAEGEAKGRAEGIAEGEAKERERIIKALKEAGVSEDVIAIAAAAEPTQ